MGSLRITGFGGLRPRASRTADSRGRAQIAHNTKLWRGTVDTFREPCLIATATVDIKSMHRKENCWVVSDNPCASFAEGDTDCPFLFSTGVMPWPAWASIPICDCNTIIEPVWKRLGLPDGSKPTVQSYTIPTMEPEVEQGVTRDRKRDARAWAYTYVDSMGREGPLSPISDTVDSSIDGTATIVIPADAFDATYDVVGIRLYRVVSRTEDLHVINNMAESMIAVAEPLYVGDYPHTAGGNYTVFDDVLDAELGQAIICKDAYAPPANLQGLISLPEGVLVGFEGKNLWFSEPWDYHAWNCSLNLDDCIKRIIYSNGNIYVMTDGHPYIVGAQSPQKDCRCCRPVTRSPMSYPILCSESATQISNGVMWASHDGIIVMRGDAIAVSTDRYIDRDTWSEWRPDSIRGVSYKGRYHGFSDFITKVGEHDKILPKGFIWDFGESAYADGDVGFDSNLITHDVPAWTTHITRDGFLFIGYGKEIRRWEGSSEPLRFVWRSSLRVEAALTNFACAKVVSEDHYRQQPIARELHFTLFRDGRNIFTRRVKDGKPFRLPRMGYGIDYEVELSGFAEVNEVHLATSMQELTLVNNA